MNQHNQIPSALYTLDLEKKWLDARDALAPAVRAMRSCGYHISFYREFMITTMPASKSIAVVNCLSRSDAKAVPSIQAALGMVQGRRFSRDFDWRTVAKRS